MHMFLNKFQIVICRLIKSTRNKHRYTQLKATLWLSFFMLLSASATATPDKNYLAIEHNIWSDKNDPDITSIGITDPASVNKPASSMGLTEKMTARMFSSESVRLRGLNKTYS